MISAIQRVKTLSSEDVKECIRKSQPVIATEMTKSWKASKLWTFDYFKERYGSDEVVLSDGRFQPLAELPLAHCMHIIQTLDLGNTYVHRGATPYIQDWVLLDIHPELQEHVELPEWFRNWERSLWKIFRPRTPYYDVVALAGPAGATTYLHRDRFRTHAWLAQLVGRKRWTIFPPNQYSLMYKKHVEAGAQPWVNIAKPDLERFPGFRHATPIEFVLRPGELIFVPSGWLHQVTSLDATISLSGNYVDGSNIALFLKDACMEALENRRERRRLPSSLGRNLQRLAARLDGDFTHLGAKAAIKARWDDCDLRLAAVRQGTSWTLSNYHHGRKYKSFFADHKTDLNVLGLNTSGREAARKLLALSPRGEFRLIAGFSKSNVILFGKFAEDLCAANGRVLSALKQLTESLAPEAAFGPALKADDAAVASSTASSPS